MTNSYVKVKDLAHLNKIIERGEHEFFILLNFGAVSAKFINYGEQEGTYLIINEIDDSEQTLTTDQLFDRNYTNVGYALDNGALYSYGF